MLFSMSGPERKQKESNNSLELKYQSIQNVSMLATAILMVGLAQGSREEY